MTLKVELVFERPVAELTLEFWFLATFKFPVPPKVPLQFVFGTTLWTGIYFPLIVGIYKHG